MKSEEITMARFMDAVNKRFSAFKFEFHDEGQFFLASNQGFRVLQFRDGAWLFQLQGTSTAAQGTSLDFAAREQGRSLEAMLDVAVQAGIAVKAAGPAVDPRIEAFIRRFDEWAFSPELDDGPRFDAMIAARGEIEDLFPAEDSSEGREQ